MKNGGNSFKTLLTAILSLISIVFATSVFAMEPFIAENSDGGKLPEKFSYSFRQGQCQWELREGALVRDKNAGASVTLAENIANLKSMELKFGMLHREEGETKQTWILTVDYKGYSAKAIFNTCYCWDICKGDKKAGAI